MNAYEDALIRRIDLRTQLGRLSPRHKQIFCGYYRHDDTLKAVAAVEGLSAARVGDIIRGGLRKIKRGLIYEPPKPERRYDLRATPPPGFDAAEFLRHMALLKRARELAEQRARKRERAELDRIMSHEEAAGWFDPPRPAKVVQPRPAPGATIVWPAVVTAPLTAPTRVEPWFDRSRLPTLEDMRYLANYTLGYFVAARRLGGGRSGLPHIGAQAAHIVCLRDADAIAGEMKRMADNLSPFVSLSAVADAVPKDLLGVTVASPYVAMRVVSIDGGQNVSIEVTWDDVQPTA